MSLSACVCVCQTEFRLVLVLKTLRVHCFHIFLQFAWLEWRESESRLLQAGNLDVPIVKLYGVFLLTATRQHGNLRSINLAAV